MDKIFSHCSAGLQDLVVAPNQKCYRWHSWRLQAWAGGKCPWKIQKLITMLCFIRASYHTDIKYGNVKHGNHPYSARNGSGVEHFPNSIQRNHINRKTLKRAKKYHSLRSMYWVLVSESTGAAKGTRTNAPIPSTATYMKGKTQSGQKFILRYFHSIGFCSFQSYLWLIAERPGQGHRLVITVGWGQRFQVWQKAKESLGLRFYLSHVRYFPYTPHTRHIMNEWMNE